MRSMIPVAAVLVTMLPAAMPAMAADQAATTSGTAVVNRGCWARGLQLTAGDDQARLRRLDMLPPAAEMLTVLRTENGCPRPVVVRYGIGGNPRGR